METKAEFQTYWVLQFEPTLTQVHRPSSDAVEICTSRNTTLQQISAQAIKGAWPSRLLTQIYTFSKKPPPPPSNIPFPAVHIFGAPNYPDEASSRLQSWMRLRKHRSYGTVSRECKDPNVRTLVQGKGLRRYPALSSINQTVRPYEDFSRHGRVAH